MSASPSTYPPQDRIQAETEEARATGPPLPNASNNSEHIKPLVPKCDDPPVLSIEHGVER
eukprot:5167360-Pyramimonas_sp.AAC.1